MAIDSSMYAAKLLGALLYSCFLYFIFSAKIILHVLLIEVRINTFFLRAMLGAQKFPWGITSFAISLVDNSFSTRFEIRLVR